MGQRHVCTFRHELRAAYRTAISAAQILVVSSDSWSDLVIYAAISHYHFW